MRKLSIAAGLIASFMFYSDHSWAALKNIEHLKILLGNDHQSTTDEVCKILFGAEKARHFEASEVLEEAYHHSDIERKKPIAPAPHPSNKHQRIPHKIIKLIDCHEPTQSELSKGPCDKKAVVQEHPPVDTLKKDIHPVLRPLIEFKDAKSICQAVLGSKLPCDPEDEELVKRAMSTLRPYMLKGSDSIRSGLFIYLADLKLRKKKVKKETLGGLFADEKSNSNQLFVPANQTRKEEKDFFKSLQKKAKTILAGKEGAIDSKEKGSSGATSKIVGEDGKTYYFKRLSDEENHSSMIGKKMGAEVAAWRLNQLLNLDIVPRTEIVQLGKKGKAGSAQETVPPNFKQGSEIPKLSEVLADPRFQDELSKLHLLNYLGAIGDRRAANLFFDLNSYKIKSIDHETGLHDILPKPPSNDREFFSGGKLPSRYSNRTREQIANLKLQNIEDSLKDVATPEQIEAIWLRVQIVRADIIQKYGKLVD